MVGNSVCSTNDLERQSSTFVNNCKKYIVKNRTFERQYATFYASRLRISTDLIAQQAKKRWGSECKIKQLCDIVGNEDVVVIGTIYKHMELHPSILKEISEEHNIIVQPVTGEYTEENDYLILEDDLQRVVLCGDINPQTHVTGINIALKGYTEDSGKFYVKDYCFASVSNPEILPFFSSDRYVLLISGISLGDPNVLFPLQILIDLITGGLGDGKDQSKFSKIVRVIIAGNSIGQHSHDFNKAKILTRKSKAETVESVKQFDEFLSQLIASVDVDVMPGEFDPTNHLLPQQPMHPCMFPQSSQYSTFNVVTNPYDATIDGVRFLGTSGQNVKDVMQYSKIRDSLEVMERLLDWGHSLPTAPDTLNCYPYLDEDPFVLLQYPHVFFSGNAAHMGSSFYRNKKTMMLAIPKFSETFTSMLLNLRTLEVEPIVVKDCID